MPRTAWSADADPVGGAGPVDHDADIADTGQGCPNASRVAWIRFFSAVRCRTRCSRQRACSRSARTAGVGGQIAGTESQRDNSASTHESILSVLQASGASPLTFCASAISTCQPASSSWSCRNRAPFTDLGTVQATAPHLFVTVRRMRTLRAQYDLRPDPGLRDDTPVTAVVTPDRDGDRVAGLRVTLVHTADDIDVIARTAQTVTCLSSDCLRDQA